MEDIGCEGFTVYHLRLITEVETRVEMNDFKGSALRGAWESYLRTLYCDHQSSRYPGHAESCPVCYILGAEADPRQNRRPYVFEPPLEQQNVFNPGDRFRFGINLFGYAHHFATYIVSAIEQMGVSQGIGRRTHSDSQRGKFRISSVEEVNPITSTHTVLYRIGDRKLVPPSSPVTAQQVAARCEQLRQKALAGNGELRFDFLTPTRIISGGKLVGTAAFVPFVSRLVDRISALRARFASLPPLSYEAKGSILAKAAKVECIDDRTAWSDVKGLSSRLGRSQPLGGFAGQAIYRCLDWSTLLPWLVWGCSTHVGKNTVKGEGWYRIQ